MQNVVRNLPYAIGKTETSVAATIDKVIFHENHTKTDLSSLRRITLNRTLNKNIIQYNS